MMAKAPRGRNQNRSLVIARHGMVCSSQPLATQAGMDALKTGGNAVDAAIACNAVLCVVEPMMCGLGGDLFAIVWNEKDGRLYGLNASGRSPFEWSLKEARKLGVTRIPPFSPLAWTVPGCVSGWSALAGRFGSRSWDSHFESAIAHARQGFPLSPVIARDWPFSAQTHPTLAATFMPQGRAPECGALFLNPDQASVLERIAEEGPEVFYHGEIADRIVSFSIKNGGYLSKRDFESHETQWVDPISTAYRGYDVWELPPNGQGATVLQMLNMLERFDIASCDSDGADHLHLAIEAKKLAFEDRATFYGDPDHASVPLDELLSKEYAAERAALIDPKRAATELKAGSPHERSDTIYLTTADSEGNMVSLIQSIYHGWGSRYVPTGLGFALQNRGEHFSLDPRHPNALAPHKRPFHTIIPAFVTQDGRPRFSFGVMGGDYQPQGHVQILVNLIDFAMDPQRAGDLPRLCHVGSSSPAGDCIEGGGEVQCEEGVAGGVLDDLKARGHEVCRVEDAFGGYQGIWREDGPRRYFGASDPRKDGCAMGY